MAYYKKTQLMRWASWVGIHVYTVLISWLQHANSPRGIISGIGHRFRALR